MKSQSQRDGNDISIKKKVLSFPTLVSFLIGGVLIYFLASRFNLDWSQMFLHIREMNVFSYVCAFFLYYVSFIFRGIRWRLLALNASRKFVENSELSFRTPPIHECSLLILNGWFVNSIAWLRMGDAYRAYAFGSRTRAGFSWSLGTIFAERVLDMSTVFVLLLIGGGLLTASIDDTTSRILVLSAFAMSLVLSLVVLVIFYAGNWLISFLPEKLSRYAVNFKEGTVGSFDRLTVLIMLGALGWGIEILRLWLVINSLGIETELALIVIAALGASVFSTVPTPGGVGVVEPGMTALLSIGMNGSEAAAVALCDRGITYLSVLVVGLLVFMGWQAKLALKGNDVGK
ncbi:MAG: flippase-like domain-containing protein [Gammaproteobacteria bacterium]|nr:flippase-like domain-containing protein [Gammaproteobacteria bacterium]